MKRLLIILLVMLPLYMMAQIQSRPDGNQQLRFPGISNGYVPFLTNEVLGFSSPIWTDGTNVGIGTTNPLEALSVVGNVDITSRLYVGTEADNFNQQGTINLAQATQAAIEFGNATDDVSDWVQTSTQLAGSSGTNWDMNLYNRQTANRVWVIDGNTDFVGFNVDLPEHQLHVVTSDTSIANFTGSNNLAARVEINHSDATNSNAGIELQNEGVSYWTIASYEQADDGVFDFTFYNEFLGDDAFFIKGSNNFLGVNNDNPAYTLDVTGTINASSDIRAITGNVIADKFRSDGGGSVTDPVFTNHSDSNTGVYFPGTDQLGLVAGASQIVRVSTTEVRSNRVHKFINGTVSSPGIQGLTDDNTGIYWDDADGLYFGTGGVEAGRFEADQDLTLAANLNFPATTSTTGSIKIGGSTLLHAYDPPFNGTVDPVGQNIFIGSANFTMGSTATATAHSSQNVGIGFSVGGNLTTAYRNTLIGFNAGGLTTSGNNNAFIGYSAGLYNTTGGANMALGTNALGRNGTGSNNTAIGSNAAFYIADGVTLLTTVNNSTYIGNDTRASSNSVTNETAIGYQAIGLASNTMQFGNSSIDSIGLGTHRFDVSVTPTNGQTWVWNNLTEHWEPGSAGGGGADGNGIFDHSTNNGATSDIVSYLVRPLTGTDLTINADEQRIRWYDTGATGFITMNFWDDSQPLLIVGDPDSYDSNSTTIGRNFFETNYSDGFSWFEVYSANYIEWSDNGGFSNTLWRVQDNTFLVQYVDYYSINDEEPDFAITIESISSDSHPRLQLKRAQDTDQDQDDSERNALLDTDIIGDVTWIGYGSAPRAGAKIRALAAENWDGTNAGTELLFYTVDNSEGVTQSVKLTIDDTGDVVVENNCVVKGTIWLNAGKTLGIFTGTGSPESAVSADVGSTFHRTDGGAGTSFYVKESGTGNTGWQPK